MKNLVLTLIFTGLITVFILFMAVHQPNQTTPTTSKETSGQISSSITPAGLNEQTNSENSVSVTVKPLVLTVGQPASLEITFTTHSGSMDFSVEKISFLTDSQGINYDSPVWDGTPPGGHHRNGTLTFKKPLANAGPISLVLQNIAQVPIRKFIWQIQLN